MISTSPVTNLKFGRSRPSRPVNDPDQFGKSIVIAKTIKGFLQSIDDCLES